MPLDATMVIFVVGGWYSWEKPELFITRLMDRVSARPSFRKLSNLNYWDRHIGPKLINSVYHNGIVGTLRIHLCHLYNKQMLRMPGVFSQDTIFFLQIRLTVLKVVDIDNWSTATLLFFFDPQQHHLDLVIV